MTVRVGLFADEVCYSKVVNEIDTFEARNNGKLANDLDFCTLLAVYQDNLTAEEIQSLLKYVAQKHSPKISKKELIALYRAKIASISSVRLVFTDTHEIYNTNKKTIDTKDLIFVMSKNSFLVDYKVLYESLTIRPDRMVVSYDGQFVRSVEFPTEKTKLITAVIDKFQSLNVFFPSQGPLASCMLLSHQTTSAAGMPLCDMAEFLTSGYAEVFELPNTDCVLVSNLTSRFYLDPKKDFSVTKSEFIGMQRNSSSAWTIERAVECILDDFLECGNGIWVPRKIDTICYSNGHVEDKCTISVSEIEINKTFDKDFFMDIIPDDAFVIDNIRNMTYRQSDSPSIDSLLKETVKSKRVFIYRYISVISGLALIVIVLVIKYRQYRKNKRDNENKTEEKK